MLHKALIKMIITLEINNSYKQNIAKVPFIFKLNASIEKRHPDFIFNNWVSNHYAME
jgi:hypothetical protein